MKRCYCCGHEHTPEEWAALPLVGYQVWGSDMHECRGCSCGSTLIVATANPRTVPA